MHFFSSRPACAPRQPARSVLGTLLLVLTLTLSLAACDGDGGPSQPPQNTITDLAADTPELSTLTAALTEAGLDDDLSGDGPFTVFAPQNSAFDGLDVGDITGDDSILNRLLTQHVIANAEVFAGDITDGQTATSLEGGTLTFSTDAGVSVNGANVVTPDVDASNGVVHIIDQVLLGRLDALQRAVVTSDLELLQAAVEAASASIATALQGDGNGDGITVFAPSNAAFIDLLDANDDGTVDDSELNAVDLDRVLQYHVLTGVTRAEDIPTQTTTVQTLLGEPVDIVRNADTGAVTLTLSDGSTVSVAAANIDVRNGVVHTLDGVLVPPPSESQQSTITDLAADTPELSTLTAALTEAGLDDDLSGDGPFTVFAPQNSAFDGLDVGDITGDDSILNRLLTQHVIADAEVFAGDITDGQTATSLEGGTLTFSTDAGVSVNGANVVTPDVDASNGVVHIIDQVLLGRLDALQRAVVTSDLELLQAAVEAASASIATALQGDGNGDGITVFAPSNAAFIGLLDANDDGTVDDSELNAVDLDRVLQYHVLTGVTRAEDIPTQTTTVQTLLGEPVDIVRNADTGAVTLTLSDGSTVSVAAANIDVRNGVVHTLDGVLVPPSN